MAIRATQPTMASTVRSARRRAVVAAWAPLAALCSGSILLTVIPGANLTFFNDDWAFLLNRPGLTADSLLTHHNGHLSVLSVLLYKGLVAGFGLDAQVPFRLVLALAVVSLGVLVYVYVAARAGRLLGLAAAGVLLFLGPAWEALLFFSSVNLIGSLATGVGVLIAMERDSPRRNALAAGLLVCSIAFSNTGLAFVVAAAIAVTLRRRPSQLWIPALPAALFAAWWFAYGRDAPSAVSLDNLWHLPRYMVDAATIGLASITGLNRGTTSGSLARGHVLLLVAFVALVVWIVRGGRPSLRVLVPVSAALAVWGMMGLNYIPERAPGASRYQIIHATVLILVAAELVRPLLPGRWVAVAAGAVAVLAIASNLDSGAWGYDFLREHSAYTKTNLGALELARGRAPADLRLTETVAHDPFLGWVTAGAYFRETDAHGKPPLRSPQALATAPAPQRQAADHVLAAAYGITPRPSAERAPRRGCRRLMASMDGGGTEIVLPEGGATLRAVGTELVAIGVRRLAPANRPVYTGFLRPRSSARISAPPDAVARPWRLTARGASAVEVCRAP